MIFPDDKIEQENNKGVLRVNLDTGERELVISIEECRKVLPDADKVASYHLYPKMLVVHPRSGRVLFNFVNSLWDTAGREPSVRSLITTNSDGSSPAYLGGVLHHPNWHTIDDRVIGNVRDFNDKVRFGFYNGDGSGLLEYVPHTTGSGHPTISPDGKWICTDGKGGTDFDNSVILCDPVSGKEIYIAAFKAVSDRYAVFEAMKNLKECEGVLAGLKSAKKDGREWQSKENRQTQCHCAWSRDGSAILFNTDTGDGRGSQLFMVDVEKSLEN